MSFKKEALDYHQFPTPGKISVEPSKPLDTQTDLAKAYSPGVAHACEAIAEDPAAAALYTARQNLVAMVTNGTAVLGLGNIGPLASKPVMEGKAVLFKKFAGINVFDLELQTRDADHLVDCAAALEPTFGGINLEDIKAPECFYVEEKLQEKLNIPVFHDDQHGTAIVVTAGVLNGLELAGKGIGSAKFVLNGAGAAALACVNLLQAFGALSENIFMFDSKGLIRQGREDLNEYKQRVAQASGELSLEEALAGADVFIGLSVANVLNPEMLEKMTETPLIFGLANPTPEIMPDIAKKARPDAIVATGRSDFPNQVNNVLCFPYLFRGALDVAATSVNIEMKKAAVKAIKDLAKKPIPASVKEIYPALERFGPDYILPTPFDERLLINVPEAVAIAAINTGVAKSPFKSVESYRAQLLQLLQELNSHGTYSN